MSVKYWVPPFAGTTGGLFAQQKFQHRVGIDFRLLHICDVGGVKHGDVGIRNVFTVVGLERGRRILPAMTSVGAPIFGKSGR